jgi:3-dehydroquinate synthase
MEALLVSNLQQFEIKSYKGLYQVQFTDQAFVELEKLASQNIFFIIDENVFTLYQTQFKKLLEKIPFKVIRATEDNKDLSKFTDYAIELTKLGVKRNVTLVAIGGGIIQDITCFLAATLFRGLDWIFFPTTLLAQADSCIGSKSSINVGGVKNLMGTFTPPNKIYIDIQFLKTLKPVDVLSGIGEMIKVHGIAGIEKLTEFANSYDHLMKDTKLFEKFLMQSLQIKKNLIEKDEFDTGPRLVMNYGHTFGHAVESASNYEIPHGIAITVGQAMACHYSLKAHFISSATEQMVQNLLNKNIGECKKIKIHFDQFVAAILKDKKNIGTNVMLIIPKDDQFKIERFSVPADEAFKKFCYNFFVESSYNVVN